MVPRTEPLVIREREAYRAAMDAARHGGSRVGFVPTMGALHAGHVALMHEARSRVGSAGTVVVSIFVNPTQFGPNEDFARYPRELDADLARCADAGVNVVFAPDASQMYPAGEQTRVRVGALAEPMCGRFRPGHFEGVATVVAKFFALTGACAAVFGRKDYQQLCVIRRMAMDLLMPVEVIGLRTVREPDGLALSSRNRYLSPEARTRALVIPRALADATRAWKAGERDAEALRGRVEKTLRGAVDSIDYVETRGPVELEPWSLGDERALIALAVRVGGARLIDNVVLGEDTEPTGDSAL